MSNPTEVSIDVNTLDDVPSAALLKLIEGKQIFQRYQTKWQFTINTFPGLFRKLQELEIDVRLNREDGGIDIWFTGDGTRLAAVWGELRRAGFKNDSFPCKGDITVGTHFRDASGDERCAIFWLYFSSTLCKQVKVGTKLVEQPVYEVHCGEELPQLDASREPNALQELI